jgi:predicted anti-sigma-YlaC factor YlaD
MNCHQAYEALQGLIDNSLNKKELVEIKTHLRNCPACKAEYRALKMVAEGLDRMPLYETSPGFNKEVFRRLGLEYKPQRRPAWQSLAMAAGLSLSVFWLTALAAALPTLLMGAKAYKLTQWLHHPELILPSFQSAILKSGLAAYQTLGFAAKVAGWLLKSSALPPQMAVAGLLALVLVFITMRFFRPQTSL